MGKLQNFLQGVKKEIKRIRWPNKKELFTYSVATVTCIVVFGVFFTGLDFLLSALKTVLR